MDEAFQSNRDWLLSAVGKDLQKDSVNPKQNAHMNLIEQLKAVDPEFYKGAVQDLMHELISNLEKAWELTIKRARAVPILAEIVQVQIDLTNKPNSDPGSLERVSGMRLCIEALIAYAESKAESESDPTSLEEATAEPKFGYAHDSSCGGERKPLNTLDEYLYHQLLSELEKAGGTASEADSVKVKAFAVRLQEALSDLVDLENDRKRDNYVSIYCLGRNLVAAFSYDKNKSYV